MTDKQIIIDGVDVSGCCYYADGKCTNSHMIQSNCKNVAVCYYKQLKRKEQECEKLKKQYNCYACGTCNGKEDYRNLERHHIGLRKSFDELHKQLDQLEEENAKLKKERKILDDETIVVEITEKQFEEYQKLKQALTEIKQLLEDALDTDKTSAEQSFDNFYKAIELCEVLNEN